MFPPLILAGAHLILCQRLGEAKFRMAPTAVRNVGVGGGACLFVSRSGAHGRTSARPSTRTASASLRPRRDVHQRAHAESAETGRRGGDGWELRSRRRVSGKVLQKMITTSETSEQVLEVVREHGEHLDHIHCVTATYRLAKFAQKERRNRRQAGHGGGGTRHENLTEDDRFVILLSAIEQQINKLDAWATANLLYSFALLGW